MIHLAALSRARRLFESQAKNGEVEPIWRPK
jgi:hypothetical protein